MIDSVVDFHSHVLPGMDDGSASVEESVAMLQVEAEQGITHVLATPHFYATHDRPECFLARRADAEQQLKKQMKKFPGLPELILGAEVSFFRGMSESDFLPQLTVDGGKCILVEMPPSPWSEGIFRELEQIWENQGITPVIAHIDRYIGPFRTYCIPERLSQMHVLVQANGDFFLKRCTAGFAMRMLKAEQIQLLGSDCHNLTTRRPNLGAAMACIREKLGQEACRRMQECGRQVLNGI